MYINIYIGGFLCNFIIVDKEINFIYTLVIKTFESQSI